MHVVQCIVLSPHQKDYFYLGVMKRLLKLWLGKGPAYLRLSAQDIHEISLAIIGMRVHWPSEFARKPRGFKVTYTVLKAEHFLWSVNSIYFTTFWTKMVLLLK